MKQTSAFTLLEILIALAVLGILAAFLLPGLVNHKGSATLLTARQQAMAIQTAMDSWLSHQTVSGARTSFGSGDYPENPGVFFARIAPYLSSESQALYHVSGSDASLITTDIMDENNWGIRFYWPASSWTVDHPKILFITP